MDINSLGYRFDDILKRHEAGEDVYKEMIELESDMDKFLLEDHPLSEKRKIYPLGLKEMLGMIRTGIEYKRGIGIYAGKGKHHGKK